MPATLAAPDAAVADTVKKYWGFDRLRPLQAEAIRAGLEQRDSLVVLPTGGGKSLCYQVPAVIAGRTDVVVSPLIALMKDQVDGLRACGYPATALYSGMTPAEYRNVTNIIDSGECRLLFAAPERVLSPSFMDTMRRLNVRAFAIDEAHCISEWGHDFRLEYRQLAQLKQRFPNVSVHAYTATATPRVREDIVKQLNLKNPHVLVGTFDRPNLVYRVIPRTAMQEQTLEAVRRHKGQAVIIYCLSRRETEDMARFLSANGVKAAAYHAGMSPELRRKTQDAFAEERIDVVAATVAFGMGIDRSDVRCVIHATLPKSVEHYQQETGRAGRDGLEAECVLFYSGGDVARWEGLIERSAENAANPGQVSATMRSLLRQMQNLCTRPTCRHKELSQYFGQSYERPNCGACDVCLDEMEAIPDSTVNAQKILSCVFRVQQRFGLGHIVDVLLGANTERIRQLGHDQLSTYGLMRDVSKQLIRNMADQLIDQKLLTRSEGEYPTVSLNDDSWRVLRGELAVRLLQPKSTGVKKTRADQENWEGVDRDLFESLRALRREMAAERGAPAFVIFGDVTLRELARVRPASMASLRRIKGVGQKKADDLGERFLSHVIAHCKAHGLATDAFAAPAPQAVVSAPRGGQHEAFRMFDEGASVDAVMAAVNRARSTVNGYLADYISERKPRTIATWVGDSVYRRIAEAAEAMSANPDTPPRLTPIFQRLNGEVPHDQIKFVLRHLAVRE